jgi:hypothetical protein
MGVARYSTYLAMRTIQGGRVVYSIRVPLMDLDVILPIPDPDNVDEDNRKVDVRHAKDFGVYIDSNPGWAAPALLVRDSGGCVFEGLSGADESVGYLQVPWREGGLSQMLTIDGQHRILGVHLEIRRLSAEISRCDRDLGKTTKAERTTKLISERDDLRSRLDRLKNESIGVDIYVEQDNLLARQMFVDVADNAKGISAAVRSRFDSSRVANRTLDRVIVHALLRGRVDMEQDRMTRNSPHLLGAKHVADLTRGVAVGIGGRINRKREDAMSDATVVTDVLSFLDCLTEAFPDLAAVSEDRLEPAELRARSLLGSVGMLRVLAGVYNKLHANIEDADIIEFFRCLAPHMTAPVPADSIWRSDPKTSVSFEVGAFAPVMRTQNLGYLVAAITDWCSHRPAFLRPTSAAA